MKLKEPDHQRLSKYNLVKFWGCIFSKQAAGVYSGLLGQQLHIYGIHHLNIPYRTPMTGYKRFKCCATPQVVLSRSQHKPTVSIPAIMLPLKVKTYQHRSTKSPEACSSCILLCNLLLSSLGCSRLFRLSVCVSLDTGVKDILHHWVGCKGQGWSRASCPGFKAEAWWLWFPNAFKYFLPQIRQSHIFTSPARDFIRSGKHSQDQARVWKIFKMFYYSARNHNLS